VTTTKAKAAAAAAAATTQSSMMTIKLANSCNQKPKKKQHGDTHNGTEDSCNKTVAVRQLQWRLLRAAAVELYAYTYSKR
jgi:hypothetical protein